MNENGKPVNIAFGATNYGPLWAPAVASWLQAVAYASREFTVKHVGKLLGAGVTDRMYTHSAENRLIADILADQSFTHIFLTECDMILPYETIPRLLEVDKPIVSGVYFLRNGNGQSCLFTKAVYNKQEPWPHTPVSIFPEDKPFKLGPKGGCPGLGCVLIQREVFEKVPYPWFDLSEGHYGSDMYFYTKAFEKDLEVWIQPKVMAGQIDYTVVSVEDYHRRLQDDPTFASSGFIIGRDSC